MMEKRGILWFDEVGKQDLSLVGGKCANLGEIRKASIPCAQGFAITTAAFTRFIEATNLNEEIQRHLGRVLSTIEAVDYEEISRCIRGAIEEKHIPSDLAEAIVESYNVLSDRCKVIDAPVAVRSSGIAEDMADASFAGQHDTYLSVRGKSDLLEKVLKCWSSLFTARAISYRVTKKIGFENLGIGVAVQKCIQAKCAGVGFTVDPVSGDASKIVNEGNWGLGESVVSGLVSPDYYVVDKNSLTVEKVMVMLKLWEVVPNLEK